MNKNTHETQQAVNAMRSVVESASFRAQLAAALPKNLSADRLVRIIASELQALPDLANCTQDSFLGAVMKAAQLGLEPGSTLGQCYILPYKDKRLNGVKKANLIIGFRGMIALAYRSNEIRDIYAHAVREGDEFSYSLGSHPEIVHKPGNTFLNKITHVYAIAHMKDGGEQMIVMTRTELDGYVKENSTFWQAHFEDMAKKTALRKLFKYLPINTEVREAIEEEPTDLNIVNNEPVESARAIPDDLNKQIEKAESRADLSVLWRSLTPALQQEAKDAFMQKANELPEE